MPKNKNIMKQKFENKKLKIQFSFKIFFCIFKIIQM